MRIEKNYYERDTSFIGAHYQPAVMLDLALSRDIDSHALLRGTRLFMDDMLTGHKLISPDQFLRLLKNGQELLNADDTSFLFGQRLFPGFFGPTSQVLALETNLRNTLMHLCDAHVILSPLCTPRYFESHSHLYIYWLDNCGADTLHTFLIEAYMTAIASMAARMSSKSLPWHFYFTHPEPRYIEQYWVHLNEHLSFNQQLNMMRIPLEHATQPWSRCSPVSLQLASLGSKAQLSDIGFEGSFLDTLYAFLKNNIRENLQLENVAEAFGISATSLKRKLLKHNTHFQHELDLARKHVALYLYLIKGYKHHEVADHLGFNDMNNFRRAFKRWTGLTPSDYCKTSIPDSFLGMVALNH